jgi:hypothetical protein
MLHVRRILASRYVEIYPHSNIRFSILPTKTPRNMLLIVATYNALPIKPTFAEV